MLLIEIAAECMRADSMIKSFPNFRGGVWRSGCQWCVMAASEMRQEVKFKVAGLGSCN